MKKAGSASNSNAWSTISLPKSIDSSTEFEKSIVKIRKAFTGIQERGHENEKFLNLMYYLLGWMVGDLGKNFSPKQPWARLQLDLCRKHPQNLGLGNFVMNCVTLFGISNTRIADRQPYEREPHGLYRWLSYYSEAIAWLFTACLGLNRGELTTHDSVKMDWLIRAPLEHRTWFLRGLADSDGSVNTRNRSVQIVTEPNTALINALFNSLNIHTNTRISKGVGVVSIPAKEAMKIKMFNPEIETHRSRLLNKLANAKTFQPRWPLWLDTKVNQLLKQRVSVGAIRDKVLWEDNTYVKLKTIKVRQDRMK